MLHFTLISALGILLASLRGRGRFLYIKLPLCQMLLLGLCGIFALSFLLLPFLFGLLLSFSFFLRLCEGCSAGLGVLCRRFHGRRRLLWFIRLRCGLGLRAFLCFPLLLFGLPHLLQRSARLVLPLQLPPLDGLRRQEPILVMVTLLAIACHGLLLLELLLLEDLLELRGTRFAQLLRRLHVLLHRIDLRQQLLPLLLVGPLHEGEAPDPRFQVGGAAVADVRPEGLDDGGGRGQLLGVLWRRQRIGPGLLRVILV
mmetsp:Transcript_99796/g.171971  ORF Transcript_99796/g.171971 Transcript_99796/m.171971 type:complete len:256 (+) Transcript_99796:1348-2115(+)